MRITVYLPDEIGRKVKEHTDNVSSFVQEALSEKFERDEQYEARRRLLTWAGTGIPDDLYETNQRERRQGDRNLTP